MTLGEFRRLAAGYPGVDEGLSYGTPGWRCGGKLLARIWPDGDTLVVGVAPEDREFLLEADPDVFFLTDHYRRHPWILVRLSRVEAEVLRSVVERAWRRAAPKKFTSSFDEGSSGSEPGGRNS